VVSLINQSGPMSGSDKKILEFRENARLPERRSARGVR
jgi:hypothetical protein